VRTAFVTSRHKWGRALTVGVTGAAAVLAVSFLSAGTQAQSGTHHDAAPTISKAAFGQADGVNVDRYTLANGHGMTVRILTYGGIIQSLTVPDRKGHLSDVVLGFPTVADYVKFNSPAAGGGVYFGALVGRYANRIAKGTFTLDGVTYHVPINNNGNSLHGGTSGFDQKVWSAKVLHGNGTVSLQLTDVSPNGEEGYPGKLTTVATYTLDNANRLSLNFKATTDAPTVVNLTNHTYWNLAGEASGVIDNQRLQINADKFTPTDSTQIPTGALEPVRGTAMDFTRPMAIGARINENDPQLLTGQGYDLNWVLNRPNNTALVTAAKANDPESGRTLAIATTQPGIQFYSGNFLTGTLVGTSGHAYRQSDGFALETQHFPDSPNQPSFPTTVLRPGQTYNQTTVWQLGVS
jgi:aldose 1-epimerase